MQKCLEFEEKVKNNSINAVYNGDARNVLLLIEKESVHLTFTSPPYYNAKDYNGEKYESYEEYLLFLKDVFQKVYEVTKEGRFLVVNTSPVIEARECRSKSSKRYPIPFDLHSVIMQIGYMFIDDIIWVKPEFSVKNRNGGFLQHRKPLGYKPNPVTEYVMVYRKKTEKLIDWNMKQYSKEVINDSLVGDDYEKTNIWQISPKASKHHPAVFPIALAERIIKYYSYKGDVILDPFAGSGTVGKACLKLDRNFILIEKENKFYTQMSKTELSKTAKFINGIA